MLRCGRGKCNGEETGVLRRNQYDMAVVGGGPAGLSAAWHGALRGLSVILFEAELQPGGQVSTVARVQGVPGVALSGPEYATALLADARSAGARFSTAAVTDIATAHEGFVLRHGEDFTLARNVVLATGGRARMLGVPGEVELAGRGVAHCATCDGPLCRGRDVAVVGGGDAALQEALVLSNYAKSVTVIVRGRVRAQRHYLAQAETRSNLHFAWDTQVSAIRGAAGVEVLDLRHADGSTSQMPCFALFAKIGSEPNSSLVAALADRDAGGAVLTDASMQTRTPGLFAVGGVRSGYDGDIVDASAEGAAAARRVWRGS